MKKRFFIGILIVGVLVSSFLVSCASVPEGGTDVLDGTMYYWRSNQNRTITFFFDAGKYECVEKVVGSSNTDREDGTYSIDGNKIILVKSSGHKPLGSYILSEDKKTIQSSLGYTFEKQKRTKFDNIMNIF
jgi:hypothetical protein